VHDNSRAPLIVKELVAKLNGQPRQQPQPDEHTAIVTGNAQMYRKAADILKALNAGAALESLEIPDGIVIDATPTQLAQLNQRLRPLGIKPPPKIPKNGWRSPIFLSAAQPARFTDLQKERAVAGALSGEGLFNKIPSDKLIPLEAFTDPLCQTLYAAALVVRHRGRPVYCGSVNDVLESSPSKCKEITRILARGGKNPPDDLWRNWPDSDGVDTSLAVCSKPDLIIDHIGKLAKLYQKRQGVTIGKRLESGELDLAQALKELEALSSGANGAYDFVQADARKFDATRLHDKPEPTILLDDKPICTAGNISVIYAKPKAGKSAVVAAVIGATLGSGDPVAALNDYLGFSTRPNEQGHALIHIDTEQSRFDHEQIVLRAARYAGVDKTALPSWLRSYCVTDFSTAERRAFLSAEIARGARECGGVLAGIVDGIGDFVHNVNDPEETHDFVLELHTLAIRYETHLLLVLHENPGEGEKTRGHLGSQLERKDESNIRIAKEGEICSIYTERSRHTHIPKARAHCFKWDAEKGMPVSCMVERPVKDEGGLIDAIFACEPARSQAGGLLWGQVGDRLVELKMSKTKDAAKTRIAKLSKDGWLQKIGDHYFPAQP
jgi:hypothetical protein